MCPVTCRERPASGSDGRENGTGSLASGTSNREICTVETNRNFPSKTHIDDNHYGKISFQAINVLSPFY